MVNNYIFYIKQAINNPEDMWYFVQGETRQFLYNNLPFLLRTHIKEQYVYRLGAASKCTENKSCIICSCSTPSLYFANKACSAKKLSYSNRKIMLGTTEFCYDEMLNKKQWLNYKKRWKL
jgi:hypothetical protein